MTDDEVEPRTLPADFFSTAGEARADDLELLYNLKTHRDALAAFAEQCRTRDDSFVMYRFYHQSFKVYAAQHITLDIVDRLRHIAPEGNEDCGSIRPPISDLCQRILSKHR